MIAYIFTIDFYVIFSLMKVIVELTSDYSFSERKDLSKKQKQIQKCVYLKKIMHLSIQNFDAIYISRAIPPHTKIANIRIFVFVSVNKCSFHFSAQEKFNSILCI